jgi:hypothetical protein
MFGDRSNISNENVGSEVKKNDETNPRLSIRDHLLGSRHKYKI